MLGQINTFVCSYSLVIMIPLAFLDDFILEKTPSQLLCVTTKCNIGKRIFVLDYGLYCNGKKFKSLIYFTVIHCNKTHNIVFRCCHMFCFCFNCSPPFFGCEFLDLKLDFWSDVDTAWIVKQGVDQDLISGKRWFCRNQVLNQSMALINTWLHSDPIQHSQRMSTVSTGDVRGFSCFQ